jgi:hypothetical protein
MGGDNVEQLWYGLYLTETVLILFVVSVVVLLCKRFLRSITWNRLRRRPPKHPMVHPLGTAQPTRKTAHLDPGDMKRRVG